MNQANATVGDNRQASSAFAVVKFLRHGNRTLPASVSTAFGHAKHTLQSSYDQRFARRQSPVPRFNPAALLKRSRFKVVPKFLENEIVCRRVRGGKAILAATIVRDSAALDDENAALRALGFKEHRKDWRVNSPANAIVGGVIPLQ